MFSKTYSRTPVQVEQEAVYVKDPVFPDHNGCDNVLLTIERSVHLAFV
jgi:hypothetical protein